MEKWNRAIEEAFKRKLPEWHSICSGYSIPGPGRVTFLEKEDCPQCGEKNIYCCQNDFGRVDCEPKFTHICIAPQCSYVIEQEIQGVSFPDIESRIDYCPWCKT